VEMEAGNTFADIDTKLDALNLGLKNLAGYDGQTIAGAISTSTHGSGISLPPLCDQVKSLVLATTGALRVQDKNNTVNFYRIEPTLGITDPLKYNNPRIVLIQDDNTFRSTITSMGCFGIIYSVVLEVCQSYYLIQERKFYTLEDVHKAIQANSSNPNELSSLFLDNRYVDFYINPYPQRISPQMIPYIYDFENNNVDFSRVLCLLTINRYSANRVASSPSGLDLLLTQQAFFDTLGILMDSVPIVTPYVINTALVLLQTAAGSHTDISYKILLLGVAQNAGYACEFSYPLIKPANDPNSVYTPDTIITTNQNVISNAQEMRHRNLWQTFPYDLRFINSSTALLSMMNGQVTVTCEIQMCINTGIQNGRYVVMEAIEEFISQTPNVRFHHGLDFWSYDRNLNVDTYPGFTIWKGVYEQLNAKRTFSNIYTNILDTK